MVISSCFKHAALLVRTLCLLLLGIPIYFFFGFWGAMDELFGGIDVRKNTTLAIEHSVEVLKKSYLSSTYPQNFFVWGTVAAVVYVCLVGVYYLLSCLGIFHSCSKELDEYATASLRHHRNGLRARQSQYDETDDVEIELERLREETESFHSRYSMSVDLED